MPHFFKSLFLLLTLAFASQGQPFRVSSLGNVGTGNGRYPAFTQAQIAARSDKYQWLRADTYALTNGAAITTTWTDQSSNARNGTPSGSPLFRDAANGINGIPAVEFTGANNFALGSQTMGASYAIWVVGTPGAGAGQKNLIRNTTTPTTLSLVVEANKLRLYCNGVTATSVATANLGATTPTLMHGRVSTASVLYGASNGNTDFASGTGFTGFTANNLNLGSGLDGKIAEVLILAPCPDDETCERVNNYIGRKYALSIYQPTIPCVVGVGDSNTDDAHASHTGASWITQLGGLYGGAVDCFMHGKSGFTVLQIYGARGQPFGRYHPARQKNVIVAMYGTNDENNSPGSVGETSAKTDSQTFYNAAKAAGFTFARLPVINIASGAPAEASRIVVETYVNANPTLFADAGLAWDYTTLNAGIWSGTRGLGTWWSDTLHVTTLGEAQIAVQVKTQLQAIGLP